ncbi:MAG: gliding motility-associated C-terminal domain-containing protein [Saprospiraceae bacterium]|nr:gliding motility-associated C-terminal domain-containing protein [Saprospiraceae bacterium]
MRALTLIIALVLFSHSKVSATHIVGGEMNYTCRGNNQYEITLTIFRDCFYGAPLAFFDNPAAIGVFNAQNMLLQNILVPLMNNDTLSPVLSGQCFVVPPDVCVHTTTYRTTVTLPPIIGGYQLSYQRCCRNQTILNIVDPLATGATYGVTISEQALLECNTSPKFQQWPPLYICVNEPITFDQSATDADGDSIVYKLCAPLTGATPNVPQPQPPNNPPYDPVTWINPPYGVANMLNGFPGGNVLQIDPFTGLLTGTPNTVGQFVVGICIEEYRNGQLISTTRRDFQYNVGVCGQPTAAFLAPELQCGDLTVNFENQSLTANGFVWHFNDPGAAENVFFTEDVTFTFSDTGLYEVILVANPNTVCQDTFRQEIYLQPGSIVPGFSYEFGTCSDSLLVQVTDLSTDSVSQIIGWAWNLDPGGQTNTLQNPVFALTESGEYKLTLTLTAENGCKAEIEQTFDVDLIEEEIERDSFAICPGVGITLNSIFDPAYTYLWSPAETLDNPNSPNPLAFPQTTTTYTVTITDAAGFCSIERSVLVFIPEAIVLDLPESETTCSPQVLLDANANVSGSYFWALNPNFTNQIAGTDTVTVTPLGQTSYYLLFRDEYGCFATGQVTLNGLGVNVDLSEPPVICEGNIVAIAATNIDPSDSLTYQWSPPDQIVLLGNTATPIVQPSQPGVTYFVVMASNQFGCSITDSIPVTVIDTSSQLAFVNAAQCSGYSVQFSSTSVNAPYYNWHFGDPEQPNATATGASVSHTYPGPGNYTVMLTLASFLPCPDTLFRTITVGEPDITVDFDWSYLSCTDTALVQFTDLSVNTQSTIVERFWFFGGGPPLNTANPILTLTESAMLNVGLVLVSSDGCRDTLRQPVNIEMVEITLEDTLICYGRSAVLNPLGNENYTYAWTAEPALENPTATSPVVTPETTTTYFATISGVNGVCVVHRQATVTVTPAIVYDLPSDTTICERDFLLYADNTGSQNVGIAWSLSPAFTPVFSTQPEVVVQPGRPTVYYLRLEDEFGCRLADSVTVSSYGIFVSAEDAVTLCIGDTLQLAVTNQGGDALTYNWSPADSILSGGNTATPLVSPAVSQPFTVEITNAFGCTTSETVQVNLFNFVPPLTVTAEPDTIPAGTEVQLEATQDDGYLYYWEPSATLNANDIFNPTATPLETTTYTLTIRDASGCINQRSVTIVVFNPECREPFIFVPNAFTPDGDGLNEVLYVRGAAIDEVFFAIYNRWGEKVFESNSKSVGWDGTFKGKMLTPDVYGYYLEVRCFNGETYFKKGNVTLIR